MRMGMGEELTHDFSVLGRVCGIDAFILTRVIQSDRSKRESESWIMSAGTPTTCFGSHDGNAAGITHSVEIVMVVLKMIKVVIKMILITKMMMTTTEKKGKK